MHWTKWIILFNLYFIKYLKPSVSWLFQQNNDLKHTPKLVVERLGRLIYQSWPQPFLKKNYLNMWTVLKKKKIRSGPKEYTNLIKLYQFRHDELSNIRPKFCQKCWRRPKASGWAGVPYAEFTPCMYHSDHVLISENRNTFKLVHQIYSNFLKRCVFSLENPSSLDKDDSKQSLKVQYCHGAHVHSYCM